MVAPTKKSAVVVAAAMVGEKRKNDDTLIECVLVLIFLLTPSMRMSHDSDSRLSHFCVMSAMMPSPSSKIHLTTMTLLPFLHFLSLLTLVASNGWSFPPKATVVVTGGTKGIGKAIVEELAGIHKCRVLTCSRHPEELQEFVSECQAQGMDVEGVVADVATPEGRTGLIDDIESFLDGKGLDVLINNVGTNIRKPSIEYTQEDLEFVLNTNFVSMFGLTAGCHKFLKRTDGSTSSVVNIGSVAAVTCIKSGTPYAATKAAMNQLTGNWACEWGPDGIRVNCVTPWYVFVYICCVCRSLQRAFAVK